MSDNSFQLFSTADTVVNERDPKTPTNPRGKYALLPSRSENKRYLGTKALYALPFKGLRIAANNKITRGLKLKTPADYDISLRQIVMSGLIRVDELAHDFLWFYKAEVCFDMRTEPPSPFLSVSNGNKDPNRRQTLSPFPVGFRAGKLRRPDVIIVKDKGTRWPGRAGPDHDGVSHGDNLARVVEVKFPGDKLPPEQEEDYADIAGSYERLTILDVKDLKPKEKTQTQPQTSQQTQTQSSTNALKAAQQRPAPIYSPVPVPQHPGKVEDWLTTPQTPVPDLRYGGGQVLSPATKSFMQEHAPWLVELGQWSHDKMAEAYQWTATQGDKVMQWTEAQLKASWHSIETYCDLAWEDLKRVNWAQIALSVKDTLYTVTLSLAKVVAGVAIAALIIFALPAELVALFTAGLATAGVAVISSN